MKPYHHFKDNNLSPAEKVQRKVIELLLSSKLKDNKRESSVIFELKHSSECLQVARILAQKRGLDLEIAETAAVLHDIYVIVHGSYKDHGKLGAPIAEKLLNETGGFSISKIRIICDAVAHHSEKDVYSNKPFVELVKDADVFNCSFFENAEKEYRRIKSPTFFKCYVNRIIKVRKELGLPAKPIFRS